MIFSTSPESSPASCALVEPVDLVSLIQALFDSFRVLADAKRIGLDAELDRTVPSTSGDPERLRQIFTNLFSNAVKFTPAGGNIPIKLERVGSDIKVSVSDTGQGISPDFLSYVFDRFRQAESSTTRRHGGLGFRLGYRPASGAATWRNGDCK